MILDGIAGAAAAAAAGDLRLGGIAGLVGWVGFGSSVFAKGEKIVEYLIGEDYSETKK